MIDRRRYYGRSYSHELSSGVSATYATRWQIAWTDGAAPDDAPDADWRPAGEWFPFQLAAGGPNAGRVCWRRPLQAIEKRDGVLEVPRRRTRKQRYNEAEDDSPGESLA